jgi:hypothetical protein
VAWQAEHRAALMELDEEATALMRMLNIEDQRFPEQKPSGAPAPTMALTDFIYEEIGRRRMNKAEIKIEAERAGYENVGRAVHLTLVNLERFRRINIGSDQKYERTARESGGDERTPFFSDMSRSH